MKPIYVLSVLVAIVGISACDDFLWPDGKTQVKGYVIDKVSGQKIANAKVYLSTCKGIFGGKSCLTLLDSTFTNGQGYYQFNFKDKRKTDFGVRVADFPDNDFVYLPSPKTSLSESNDYLVKEGKQNDYTFYVLTFKVLKVNLVLQNTGYQDLLIHSHSDRQILRLAGKANSIDTTFYFRALPRTLNSVDAVLEATGKTPLYISEIVHLGAADTTEMTIRL